ncbi:LysR family transcriptional regulator [Magnetospirillum sulfuroxidans]|uniref:LysR family transcriptional regulator n=1 Tax=Magnetospirillum sulfuroxidans TaxID=611300 RepID=A0ABS5IEG2_9PROT|nr:LysR family transcriptional regulator [Magnetospirillum sulfuroxidans]MBR9972808.1 LysR family transcriptional regulator [Magnetospirillum sulfuroxidans]
MNLTDVAVFVEAVSAGSLAAAARKLEIAAMAATRRLAALESELAVRLVHRTTRALALTAEGEAFLPYAQALLEEAANGRAAIRPPETGASGLLRVTSSVPFGRKVVMAMLPAFMHANPLVRVDLLQVDTMVDIVSQGIDLAIRIAPLRDSTLVARKLADSPRRLYVAPAYVAAHGMPRQLNDLTRHECLAISGTSHWAFDCGGRGVRQKIACRFTANSIEALHQACLDGLGVTILADWNAAEDVAAGRLLAVPLIDAQPEGLGIWAVYPSARLLLPKVRLFVEALKTHLDAA